MCTHTHTLMHTHAHIRTHMHTHKSPMLHCTAAAVMQARSISGVLLLGASLSVVLDALGSERLLMVWTQDTVGESAADDSGWQGWMYFGPRRCSLPQDTQVHLPLQLIALPSSTRCHGWPSSFWYHIHLYWSVQHFPFLLPCDTVLCFLAPVVLGIKVMKVGSNDVIHLRHGSPCALEAQAGVH